MVSYGLVANKMPSAKAGEFLNSPALASLRTELQRSPIARGTGADPLVTPIQDLSAINQRESLLSRLGNANQWGAQMTDLARQQARNRAGMQQVSRQVQTGVPGQTRQGNYVTPVSRGVSTAGTQGINGRLDTKTLAGLSFARGHMLDRRAAQALEQMNAAYRAATGRNIGITDSYRTLKGQQNLALTKPGLAAKPGTSVHGLGKALDLNVRGDPQLKAWLDRNGARFGYSNPNWAKNPKRLEPWHWEFIG